MFNTEQNATPSNDHGDHVKATTGPGSIRQYQDAQDSLGSLAENEKWLADNVDKMVRMPSETPDEGSGKASAEKPLRTALASDEERVLLFLGAAVIMRWNAIPAKLQRELFDAAGSMGEILDTSALRGQIARFLHKHKDDTSVL